jgi:hypothetical protein
VWFLQFHRVLLFVFLVSQLFILESSCRRFLGPALFKTSRLLVWRLGNAKEILSTIRLALALSYSGQSKRQSMVEKRRAKGRKKKKENLSRDLERAGMKEKLRVLCSLN